MKYNDLKVGLSVKAIMPENSIYYGVDFDLSNHGCSGKIIAIDNEKCNLTVEVEFDNGNFDWGNHNSLVQIDKPVDTDSIHDKLSKIEKLIEEIKGDL